ncbi:TPR domain-containing protein [Enterococcus haemoperoxidus ATCC BAA-382]|uniref:TPR domain-containing protein n=1 Tax=Enterococcus haemoperoxidus ATCC BAA-382 TaxID=1158608 RepID=R2STP3_9ENTE|nr:tetratricopeptide repeat protein [Enterococcus haemoperoxidus]EOH98610.1 TPR domain-containing protein [Enterococcus haemoperoxidus ATCC BAA-382]EOT62207.1 TPR domain-containing protein [Enterococcus haemoperoxidus ATCC BAA-382]OJG55711.1 TPR domain-containing protein [Enterococcus haemoperoxidus]
MTTYSEKMLEALHEEDLAQAQLMLAEAIRKDDDDTLADLGEELLSLGFLEEAKLIFDHLLKVFPDADGLNIPLAEIAIENNLIDDAFVYLEKVGKDSDSYVQSLLVTADLYQVIGIPEVSEAKLKEAQRLMPDEPLILFALGELYFSNGQFQEASAAYQKLLEAQVTEISNVSINERLGSSQSMSGDFEEAIPFLEKALEEGQTDDRLFQLAFTYLQLHENQKAIALLQQLRALNPHYQSLYLSLGEALQEEEQLEEARTVLAEGIKENPFQVDLYQLASENAYRLHDTEKAESLLKQALELGEKTDETRLTLSNLYLNENRFDEVIEVVQQMEEQGHPYGEWNLAHAYNELEEFALAKVHYEQAYQELSHEPEFLKEYAVFLREEGQLEKAKELLQHYLQHEPGDNEAVSLLEDIEER